MQLEQLHKIYVFISQFEGHENCLFNQSFNIIFFIYFINIIVLTTKTKIIGNNQVNIGFLVPQRAYSFTIEIRGLYLPLFMGLKNYLYTIFLNSFFFQTKLFL